MTEQKLIDFINQERLTKKINNRIIIIYFNKILIKSFIDINKKLNIKNKNFNIIQGIKMIKYIYYILTCYTNNLKLTIFFIDRSIMLFSEFMIMSQDKNIIKDICFIPDVYDAISFCYKKTIGPIVINSLENTIVQNNSILLLCNLLTQLYIQLFIYIINNDKDINTYIQFLALNIETYLIKIINKKKNIYIYTINYIYRIISIENKSINILDKIIIIKIILETILIHIKSIHFYNFYDELFNKITDYDTRYYNDNYDIKSYDLYKYITNNINL